MFFSFVFGVGELGKVVFEFFIIFDILLGMELKFFIYWFLYEFFMRI